MRRAGSLLSPKSLGWGFAVSLVTVHVTQGNEIFNGVLTFVLVMLLMVEFKHLPEIVGRKHASMPTTFRFNALEPVALQNRNSNKVGNGTVVFICLTVLFQNIYTDSQILTAAVFL